MKKKKEDGKKVERKREIEEVRRNRERQGESTRRALYSVFAIASN
jgi:hypothetical protein